MFLEPVARMVESGLPTVAYIPAQSVLSPVQFSFAMHQNKTDSIRLLADYMANQSPETL